MRKLGPPSFGVAVTVFNSRMGVKHPNGAPGQIPRTGYLQDILGNSTRGLQRSEVWLVEK